MCSGAVLPGYASLVTKASATVAPAAQWAGENIDPPHVLASTNAILTNGIN